VTGPARTWATTAEVCDAGKIATSTAFLWAKRGVLPTPTTVAGGKRGRSSRWPLHAPEQARWVAGLLDAGFTFAEIAAMLERGEFKPAGGS
jgi:DNA-binding transcriptional MerR regulator